MGYAVYKVGKRWGGYGVPAYCEYPDCSEEIDRGVSYACGGEPFSEHGCDRYFCEKHLVYHGFNVGGHREYVQVCKRCDKKRPPFPYKTEHPEWAEHFLKDESWAAYRKNNREEVKEMKKVLASCLGDTNTPQW